MPKIPLNVPEELTTLNEAGFNTIGYLGMVAGLENKLDMLRRIMSNDDFAIFHRSLFEMVPHTVFDRIMRVQEEINRNVDP